MIPLRFMVTVYGPDGTCGPLHKDVELSIVPRVGDSVALTTTELVSPVESVAFSLIGPAYVIIRIEDYLCIPYGGIPLPPHEVYATAVAALRESGWSDDD